MNNYSNYLYILMFFIVVSCRAQDKNRKFDDRFNCLHFSDLELSESELRLLDEEIFLFYGDAFNRKDLCVGKVIGNIENDRIGLYSASPLHSHFHKFYFIRGSNQVTVIKANAEKSISLKSAVDDALQLYSEEFDSQFIDEIKAYLCEAYSLD